MDAVAAWLAAHMPESGPADPHPQRLQVRQPRPRPRDLTRVRGVLDWEMATIGDPLMDLGTALCYWVEARDPPELRAFAFGPTAAPGSYTRREFAEHYARRTGRSLEHLDFYAPSACLRPPSSPSRSTSGYVRGFTKDPRFAAMIHGVRALSDQALALTHR
jgi:aminoglycoside phosphotransferase (APT) family kinase protein